MIRYAFSKTHFEEKDQHSASGDALLEPFWPTGADPFGFCFFDAGVVASTCGSNVV
jgi:hypothetical protein